ncbi:ribosome small subunit-dependent GTPase A [Lapidilactobacillus bayanensis]|uniref:ribosome small subunit-dependent GTPase A n=1 Tax=Lapidilactobacillus bayanensis TaxID=2485998 RepID=UPI000F777B4B|nr:ribosome small subunit-dependent GTPase A [Lapidilactobacillus bayanensis]
MHLQNNEQQYQISLQAQTNYKVIDHNQKEQLAKLSGQLLQEGLRPAVGDYVIGLPQPDFILIKQILPRKSVLQRQNFGDNQQAQVIAANLDHIFITMSLNQDFNLARLDRYLTLVWDSGANPVIVLTKADLIAADLLAERRAQVAATAFGVPVLVTEQDRPEQVQTIFAPYLTPQQNVAFVGSSGVGKSTLVNLLQQETTIKTKTVRADDDKGRHTTTTRALYVLPNGAKIIDTPGIRSVGVAGVSQTATDQSFQDIATLAQQCRFNDCQHQTEPGCAVKAAIAAGQLAPGRLASYQKLQIEVQYAGLNSRQIGQLKIERMLKDVGGVKGLKKTLKKK